jgi:hypothetical protein
MHVLRDLQPGLPTLPCPWPEWTRSTSSQYKAQKYTTRHSRRRQPSPCPRSHLPRRPRSPTTQHLSHRPQPSIAPQHTSSVMPSASIGILYLRMNSTAPDFSAESSSSSKRTVVARATSSRRSCTTRRKMPKSPAWKEAYSVSPVARGVRKAYWVFFVVILVDFRSGRECVLYRGMSV